MPESTSPREQARVLRVIEYSGDRAAVEKQVAQSIHGEKEVDWTHTGHGKLIIRAATIGSYPEVLQPPEKPLKTLTRMTEEADGYKVEFLDPRDPDPTKEGIFQTHNCWKCKDGTLPCPNYGGVNGCEYPRARND